ncbi:MAG: HdeD family acid-resistance protein [Anaerovoracaceae bacterium]|jgi:uncharacterized membrane protein HdeD (DUF308 family)
MTDKEIKRIERLSELKRNNMMSGIVSLVIGVVLTVWPGMAMSLVCRIIGAALLVLGVVYIVMHFSNKEHKMAGGAFLVMGIILAVLGLWIWSKPAWLIALIPLLVGIILAVDGVMNVAEAVVTSRQGYGGWWFSLILAILTIAVGLLLAFNPFEAASTVTRIIGIAMIYSGITDLWIVSRIDTKIHDVNVKEE